MPGANPLVEEMPGAPPSLFAVGASGQARGLGASAQVGAEAGVDLGDFVGGDPEHQTNYWMAAVMLAGLGVIVALHMGGFRFSTDVGITRG
jgi:hypothetical protein